LSPRLGQYLQPFRATVVGAAVLFLLAAWPFLCSLAVLFAKDGDLSHGFVVVLVSLWSLWDICHSPSANASAAGSWLGLPPMGVGLGLMVLAYWYAEGLNPGGTGWVCLGSVGLLAALAGAVMALGGRQWLRRLAFPLGFLVFALPLPASLLAMATLRLRLFGSYATAALLPLVGVEVTRDGNVLHTAGGTVGIIDACSGMRSLWVLLAAAVAILHFGRFGWRRTAVLLVSVPVLALCCNLIRLFVTVALVAHGHHGAAEGAFHASLGMVVFLLALAGLWGIARLLGRPATDSNVPQASAAETVVGSSSRLLPVSVLALLAVTGGLRFLVTQHYAVVPETEYMPGVERKTFAELPVDCGGFTMMQAKSFHPEELAALQPTDQTIAFYMNSRGQTVEAQFSYWRPQSLVSIEAFRHPHWPDTCYPSQGWTRLAEADAHGDYSWLPGISPRVRVFRRDEGANEQTAVLVAWRSRADPRRLFVPAEWGERLRALVRSWRRTRYRVQAQYGVTLRVFIGRTVPDSAAALAVIDEFGQAIGPQLSAFGLTGEGEGDMDGSAP